MTAEIYHFPGTDQEVNDQIDQSERPMGFMDAIRHITRAQQPLSITWSHLCPCKGMDNIRLEDGQICPNCFKGSDGKYHGR